MLKLQVKISTLMITWCAFLWCTPQGLNLLFSQYASLFNVLRCLMWGVLLFWLIVRKKKIGGFGIAMHLFGIVFLCCIVSVEFTKNNMNTWLVPFCSICGFCILVSLYSEKQVTICFFRYFYLISLINLILLFVMPKGFAFQLTAFDGLSTYNTFSNFVSTDNTYAPFLMCFLMLGELCKDRIKKKRYVSMWLISLITALKIWSATCLIGLVMYIIILFSKTIRKILGKLTIRKIMISFIVIFVLIYYMKIQNLFSIILVSILGKDLTLTGRIGLWSTALEMIKEKWIAGWGNKNSGAIILRDYYYWYAHNIVLDILLEGGVITLISFIALLGTLAKQIRGQLSDSKVKICLIVMIIFMILNITESYFSSIYFYIPMILMAQIATNQKYFVKNT